jgi:hypothetical protein
MSWPKDETSELARVWSSGPGRACMVVCHIFSYEFFLSSTSRDVIRGRTSGKKEGGDGEK